MLGIFRKLAKVSLAYREVRGQFRGEVKDFYNFVWVRRASNLSPIDVCDGFRVRNVLIRNSKENVSTQLMTKFFTNYVANVFSKARRRRGGSDRGGDRDRGSDYMGSLFRV